MCWALVIGLLYLTVSSATNWRVPGISAFTPRNPVLIRFPKLYHTLSRVVGNRGKKWNRNVVFVAGNILSATKLADVACEMAEFKRCNVHLALMLVEDFDVDDFRRFNALGETDTGECRVVVHDARPEAVRDMSPERRRLAVKSAFRHIGEFMHPKAILIDPTHEDEWFVEIAKEKAEQMNSVLIELPEKILRDLRWITRLDSGGLNGMAGSYPPSAGMANRALQHGTHPASRLLSTPTPTSGTSSASSSR